MNSFIYAIKKKEAVLSPKNSSIKKIQSSSQAKDTILDQSNTSKENY